MAPAAAFIAAVVARVAVPVAASAPVPSTAALITCVAVPLAASAALILLLLFCLLAAVIAAPAVAGISRSRDQAQAQRRGKCWR
jgi:hypothetical protein